MKILQVIPFYKPAFGFGGPVKVCSDISELLVKRGFQVSVATTDAYDRHSRVAKNAETIKGVKVVRFRNLSPWLAKDFNLYLPRGFKQYIRNNLKKFDLVHLHSFFTYQNIICAKYCRKYKIPYIIHLHEMPMPIPLFKKSLIKRVFNLLYGKKLLKNAAKILVVSPLERDRLAGFIPSLQDKIEVALNPIEPPKRKPIKPKRREYGLNQSDKVFLFLGRLSFIKGLEHLIAAFAKLAKKDPHYKLIIAGPDESGQLKKLERQIGSLGVGNKVIFTGLVEGKNKEELFGISDIFVLFSHYESFSLATLEAISHGLPVCLSKEVGIAEVLEKYGCAQIIKNTSNKKRSALQLELAYKNRSSLKKNCQKAIAEFSLKKTVAKISAIYFKLTQKTCS
ncbi:MAG: glycosyltransferase [Candidatus Berkelbacteria bacterium]|nr:glycosyltransferase [Candidatus Berkelbacteria bacterium]